MSTEQSAARDRAVAQTPADKTDAPRRIRKESVSLLDASDFLCVEPSVTLFETIRRMKESERGAAVVCEGKRIVGIFTEHDFLTKIAGEEVDMNRPVQEWMTKDIQTLAPGATIGDAVRVMNETGHSSIPLINNDELAGAISVFDVITYLAESYPKETMNLPPASAQVLDAREGG